MPSYGIPSEGVILKLTIPVNKVILYLSIMSLRQQPALSLNYHGEQLLQLLFQ